MPERAWDVSGFDPLLEREAPEPAAPTLGETWGAAFELENDVVNAWQMLTRPTFQANPTFNTFEHLKKSKYWDNYRNNFLGVRSEEEFNFIAGQIDQEQEAYDVLARSGWGGYVAMAGAGMLSPTMMIPLLGPSRGLKGIAEAAALGFGVGAAQELVLQGNQQTRTWQDSAGAISANTVLSGILGGVVLSLRKGEMEALEAGMARARGAKAIRQPTAAGADVPASADPGRLDPGLAGLTRKMVTVLDSNPVTRSPVTDTFESDFMTGRMIMAQISDGGYVAENNAAFIPTSVGGTVENNMGKHYGAFARFVDAANDAYNNYIFDGAVPTILPNVRATIRGMQNAQKLSRREFNEQVWYALHNGDQHEIPAVAKAATAARKEIYDPMLKLMQETKVLGDQLREIADLSFVNWVFDRNVIRQNPQKFIDFLQAKYTEKLQQDFSSLLEKKQLEQARDKELLEDMARPQDEIDQLREEFTKKLKDLEARMEAEQFTALEDTISQLRAAARPLKEGGIADEAMRKQMLRDAKDMEVAAGPQFAANKLERRELKRRLSNLNKAGTVVEKKLEAKLAKIERAEELSLNTLNRAVRAGAKFLDKMDDWSDEVLDAELGKLQDQFARMGKIYDSGEDRLARMIAEDEPDAARMLALEDLQGARAERMSAIAERIADAEDLGRPAMRSLIDDAMQEMLQRSQRIVEKRAVRTARLREGAKALTPEAQAKRLSDVEARMSLREGKFNDRVRVMGAENFDEALGKADFTNYAREAAENTKDEILGTYVRLPVVEIMGGKRGSELPRLLGFIKSSEMAPYLNRNIEDVLRTYLRTVAPDVEMARKFGSVNAQEQLDQLGKELNAKQEAIANATTAKGEPRDQKWKDKETARVQAEYDRVKSNLETVIRRIRHQHGLPADPDGMGYRMAKTVMGLNVLRYMGVVTISSLPDVANVVMRHGMYAVRDGFIPFVKNMKEMKLLKEELKYYGVGVEAETAARAESVLGVMDDLQRGSKFERGVEYASGKQGIIALFSYWTDGMKRITAAAANARMMDSIGAVMEGTASQKQITFLAENGFNENLSQRVWAEMQNGGGAKVNGVWLPNTESWKDKEAMRAFRAAVLREANTTIVTPGVERPAWMTGSTMGRLIGQFKSFGFSATGKILGSGLQHRDMAFASGVVMSLALGALSYYISSMIKGGDAQEKMMNADWQKWADEAVQRAGLLSAFGFGQDLASRIPAVAPYVSFSGQRSTRRGGDDLVSAGLGPTFDFITKGANVITTLHDPSTFTASEARKMMPWQNTIGLSKIWDAIEAGVPVRETR